MQTMLLQLLWSLPGGEQMPQTNLIGQKILGYTVVEKINSGAFGTVYKVEKVNPSGKYIRALKHITIPSEKQYMSVLNSMGGDASKADNYFSEMLNDIVSEIQILNDLSEKGVEHIVRYYENEITMTDAPRRYDVYILMEYLTPLDEYITANSFTVRDVLTLAFDVLEGLKACHANGVWHRDIKNENIFASKKGGYKIGDFGVSKVLKDSSKAESLKGTPNFLAPEVYLGKSGYTKTVDLYSLGIVLYRLLNYGRNPFLPKFPEQYFVQDEDAAFEKRMEGMIPDLPALGGEKVGAVVVKAIADSQNRYQTAEDFLDDLTAAIQNIDIDLLMQSIKTEMVPQMGINGEKEQKIYAETIGEISENIYSGVTKAEEEKSSPVNKHLFDTIGENPVVTPVLSTKQDNFINDNMDSSDRKVEYNDQKNDLQQSDKRIIENVPSVKEQDIPEAIDCKAMRKMVFAVPIIFLLIALVAYFIVIPHIYGQIVSFGDWLCSDQQNIINTLRNSQTAFSKVNYIILIRVFWYVWMAGFIASLFFMGKQLQKKPETNAENAILVRKEPYMLALDITEALKHEYQKNKNKEIKNFLVTFKRLEERLSVESDFGCGKNNVIECENNIAKQLQYLLKAVPYLSNGNIDENIFELNKAVVNINSLLKMRIELKKK